MKNRIFTWIMIVLLGASYTSCDKFLDEAPDGRVDLDTEDKLTKLLTSAYTLHLPALMTETMSDNVDDRGDIASSLNNLHDQMYYWKDIVETGNESPNRIWNTHYLGIAAANQVLKVIEEWGNPERLNPQRGEALLIRAYMHFALVNTFCQHYTESRGETDLGITYMEEPETTVNPPYQRGTVAEVYRKIERDLTEGLPLIDNNLYSVPKYHFNRRAANAFAARFYLYYQKYDKVIEHANYVLGSKPELMLRDVERYTTFTQKFDVIAEDYIRPEHNANLLLFAATSYLGRVYGNYTTGKKYMHHPMIATNETTRSKGPWGNYSTGLFYLPSLSPSSSLDYIVTPKFPSLSQSTDPVAGTVIRKTVYTAFHADETLLCRAEAYIMLQDYDSATRDLALWMSRHTSSKIELTRKLVNEFYSQLEYSEWDKATPKKRLNPDFTIVPGEQENFLHCLLHFRRIETITEGLRWYDIKRYGIVIYRRYADVNYNYTLLDELTVDDPRRAIQLPADVINAGIESNPRKK